MEQLTQLWLWDNSIDHCEKSR